VNLLFAFIIILIIIIAAARRKAPSIVFIDELDAIGSKRNPKDQTYMKQTLNQLLVDLDGFVGFFIILKSFLLHYLYVYS
jgi:hypothetical protein